MRDTLQLMTVDKARNIVKEIVAARLKWGKLVSVPYKEAQIYDALLVLDKAGNFDGGTKEEVTKLRRQLAACQNREKRYAKDNQALNAEIRGNVEKSLSSD